MSTFDYEIFSSSFKSSTFQLLSASAILCQNLLKTSGSPFDVKTIFSN